MAIKYQWNCVRAGQDLSSVYVRPDFIPDNVADLYLLPGRDISCRGCAAVHFLRWSDRVAFQFNDRASGDALTYGFPPGTFQRLGTFPGENLGHGTGTLTISETVGESQDGEETGCC